MTTKYRIYIDEVGNPDLGSSDNPNHRFLSLTGVILELGYVVEVVNSQMEELKKKFFTHHPDEPLIFHRKEMVNARTPFESFENDDVRSNFDKDLLNLLREWNYTVISVCLDKKRHRDTFRIWRDHPYHYCLEVLLERFVFFLNLKNCKGDVMAESRGGKEDMKLKKAFSSLHEKGTHFVEAERFQNTLTSKQLKVKPKSNNITGLQLADLLAHPSRNEILNEQKLLQKKIAPFAKSIIEILEGKYYQQDNRVFGKKFL